MTYSIEDWDLDTDFDRWYTTWTGAMLDRELGFGAKVLEIGCAAGHMTQMLANRSRQVTAITLDRDMLERAKRRVPSENVTWICGDVMNLDRPRKPYNAIVCCSMLHEVEDLHAVLRKIASLADPKTRIVITMPSANSLHHRGHPALGERAEKYGVRRIYTPMEWHNQIISGTGLTVIDRFEYMLKPYENEQMQCLAPEVLNYCAQYRGPGGALVWFDLAKASS